MQKMKTELSFDNILKTCQQKLFWVRQSKKKKKNIFIFLTHLVAKW